MLIQRQIKYLKISKTTTTNYISENQ